MATPTCTDLLGTGASSVQNPLHSGTSRAARAVALSSNAAGRTRSVTGRDAFRASRNVRAREKSMSVAR